MYYHLQRFYLQHGKITLLEQQVTNIFVAPIKYSVEVQKAVKCRVMYICIGEIIRINRKGGYYHGAENSKVTTEGKKLFLSLLVLEWRILFLTI